jgi:hypothetical protein
MFEAANSTEVHLRIGQRNLWNVPSESSQKGLFFEMLKFPKIELLTI